MLAGYFSAHWCNKRGKYTIKYSGQERMIVSADGLTFKGPKLIYPNDGMICCIIRLFVNKLFFEKCPGHVQFMKPGSLPKQCMQMKSIAQSKTVCIRNLY